MIAFEIYEKQTPAQVRKSKAGGYLVGYQEIICHFIFDIKLDISRKSQFVAGGHTTMVPDTATYSSMVSRDSICLAFMATSLHGVGIMACNILNAYLNTP